MNWLFIKDGVVQEVVVSDRTPTNGDYSGVYDTLTFDDSGTFKVGDSFSVEKQVEANRTQWTAKGWLEPVPVPPAPEVVAPAPVTPPPVVETPAPVATPAPVEQAVATPPAPEPQPATQTPAA